MNIHDSTLTKLIHDKKKDENNLQVINLDSSEVLSFTITRVWERIEYLSLRNNFIKEINFLQYFPMLLYLDMINNPIVDFELFNKYNSYLYLGLTAPQSFLIKKILLIKGLNVAILDFDISNELLKEQFLKKNPNIIFFNGHFHCNHNNNQGINSVDNTFTCGNSNSLAIPLTNDHIGTNVNDDLKKIKDNYRVIDNNPKNSSLTQLIGFIKSYNMGMKNIIIKEQDPKALTYTQRISKTDEEKENELINANNNIIRQKLELNRILILSKYYHQISLFTHNKDSLNVFTYYKRNKRIELLIPNKKSYCPTTFTYINLDLFKEKTIQMQLFVSSIIYLYIVGIFSKDIASEILNLFYITYEHKQEPEEIKKTINVLFNMDFFIILSFYYDIYQYFIILNKELSLSQTMRDNQIDNGVHKYDDLYKNLQMLQFTSVIQSVKKQNDFNRELSRYTDAVLRGELIYSVVIKFFFQVNIFNETLQIIQFVNDFMISNKYEGTIVKNHASDYSLFHEIKEQMYKHINTKQDSSLAEKKYHQNKMKTLKNKYFFQTSKYSNFTSIGAQLNMFFAITNVSYLPAKPVANYRHWSIDDEDVEEQKKEIKFSQELQQTLRIKSERKVSSLRKTYKDGKLILSDAHLKQPTIMKNISRRELVSDNFRQSTEKIRPNMFSNSFMRMRISQSMTNIVNTTKKFPQINIQPPKYKVIPKNFLAMKKYLNNGKTHISEKMRALRQLFPDVYPNYEERDSMMIIEPKNF